ncbi:MAG: hypothetical protein NTZ05_02335 [Chloroflexi bacterium]|nr:hypothetical protein [Chloroflexota bacterium]
MEARRQPYEEERLGERRAVPERGEPRMVERPGIGAAAILESRDAVRWGPILGGAFAATGIMLLLGTLGAAIGLSATQPGVPGAAGGISPTAAGVWSAVSLIVALFIGGYISGRYCFIGGTASGISHGAVTWAVTLVLTTFLAALGAVIVMANVLGALVVLATTPGAAPISGAGSLPSLNAFPNLVGAAAGGLWWTFAALLLGLLAAAAGGWLGGTQVSGRPIFRL